MKVGRNGGGEGREGGRDVMVSSYEKKMNRKIEGKKK